VDLFFVQKHQQQNWQRDAHCDDNPEHNALELFVLPVSEFVKVLTSVRLNQKPQVVSKESIGFLHLKQRRFLKTCIISAIVPANILNPLGIDCDARVEKCKHQVGHQV
jgi:hypothetical protein